MESGALSFFTRVVPNGFGYFSKPAGPSARLPEFRHRSWFHPSVAPNDPYSFRRLTGAVVGKPACKHPLVPTMTDTILIIRCPHCMAGIEFRPLTAYNDGRF